MRLTTRSGRWQFARLILAAVVMAGVVTRTNGKRPGCSGGGTDGTSAGSVGDRDGRQTGRGRRGRQLVCGRGADRQECRRLRG